MNRCLRRTLHILFLLPACATNQEAAQPPAPDLPDPDLLFSYADTTARYVQTSLRNIAQEISGQTTSSQVTIRYQLTAEITGDAGSRVVRFTVDSILEAEGAGVTRMATRRLEGQSFQGAFGETGKVSNLTVGTEKSPVYARLNSLLGQFFPVVPEQGPRPGSQWIDTTHTTTDDGSTQISTVAVVTNTAGEWREDGSGLPITWVADYSFAGQGEQLGQNFTLEGTGRRTGEHLLSPTGIFLSTSFRDSSEATVLLPAIGITVPVLQTGVDSIRIIP